MIKKTGFVISLLVLFFQNSNAQNDTDSLVMNFHLKFDNQNMDWNKKYISAKKDTIQIDEFKLHISSIGILLGKQVSFFLPLSDEIDVYSLWYKLAIRNFLATNS